MYSRGYGYNIKGSFNWSMPTPRSQQIKAHNSEDRCSHPLFSLVLLLSTFLAISAAILTVSEYWAIEAQIAGQNCPCKAGDFSSVLGSIGSPVSEQTSVKFLDRFKDNQFAVIGSETICRDDPVYGIARSLSLSGSKVVWIATQALPAGGKKPKSKIPSVDILSIQRQLNDSRIEAVSSKSDSVEKIVEKSDIVLSDPASFGSFLEAAKPGSSGLVFKKAILWITDQKRPSVPPKVFANSTAVGALLAPFKSTSEFWKKEAKKDLNSELPRMHVIPPTPSDSSSAIAYDSLASRKLLREFVREWLGLKPELFLVTCLSYSKAETESFLQSFKSANQLLSKSTDKKLPAIQGLVLSQSDHATSETALKQFLKSNPAFSPAVRLIPLNCTSRKLPFIVASDAIAFNSISNSEEIAQTAMDSLFLRVPVLATSSEELKEIVQNRTTALLHEKGSHGGMSLARDIFALSTELELSKKLAVNGFELAKKSFWHHKKLGKVIRQLLNELGKSQRKKGKSNVKVTWEVV